MFSYRDRRLSLGLTQHPFQSSPIDETNPNLQYKNLRNNYGEIYYYQEKKIIDLLQTTEPITEKEYQTLFLLVNTPIPEEYCIAKTVWFSIAELKNYETFKFKEKEIKNLLSERFKFIKDQARFVFETSTNICAYLLQSDVDPLDPRVLDLLQKRARDGRFFNPSILESIKSQLIEDMNNYAEKSGSTTNEHLILGNLSKDTVTDIKAYEDFQNCRKCLSKDIPLLIQAIVKMRFMIEFKEDQRFNQRLYYTLFMTLVRQKGLGLLDEPQNKATQEEIQEVLNSLLFEETRPEEIDRLVQLGAQPNTLNSSMRTALGHALFFNQCEKALQLLKLGADPNILSHDATKASSVMVAISRNMPEELILELSKKTNDLDYQNKFQETALMLAIKEKASLHIVEEVIQRTKKIDAKNNQSYRALDMAINAWPSPHAFQIIKRLIAKGASPLVQNDEGNFPLLQAAYTCNLEVVKYLFHLAPELLNEPNHQGETALLIVLNREAHLEEALEIIDFLILQGANPCAGKNALLSARQNPQLCLQMDKSFQKLADKRLKEGMIRAFSASFFRLIRNPNHRLESLASAFIKRYRNYLYELSENKTPQSLTTLKSQLSTLQKQTDFSVRYSRKILQDIITGGNRHKKILSKKPDLIDRFLRLEVDSSCVSQVFPMKMGTSRSYSDSKQILYGESSNLFTQLDNFHHQQDLAWGEDFSLILSDPRIWTLPEKTLILMYQNQILCKRFILEWGFEYEHFPHLTQRKCDLVTSSTQELKDLEAHHIPIKELIRLNEERLTLLLNHIREFYVLYELGVSLERFNTIEISQLVSLIEESETVLFLASHHLSLMQILAIESSKLQLISAQHRQLNELIESNIPLDAIVSLPIKELAILLSDHGDESEAILAQLKIEPPLLGG